MAIISAALALGQIFIATAGFAAANLSRHDAKDLLAEHIWHTFSLVYSPKGPDITFMTATWSVPAVPRPGADQEIDIWPGMETEDTKLIVQPVLTYNSRRSRSWGLACYVVSVDKQGNAGVIRSPVSDVEPGTEVTAIIELKAVRGNQHTYKCGFAGHRKTELVYTTDTRLNSAWVEYEVHRIHSCLDYFRGVVAFRDVEVRTADGFVNSKWYAKPGGVTDPMKCGMKVQILNDSTGDGRISIGIPTRPTP